MRQGMTLAGLFTALAVVGCAQNQPATPPTTVVTTAPAAPTATTVTTTSPAATDTKINTNAGPGTSNGTDSATADAVNMAIVHNKQMTGSRVEVVVTDGVARLNGTVQDPQQKALAGTAAGNTPGVSSVLNKIQIVATGGAHAKTAPPKTIVKVYNHTTVIHDTPAVPVPSSSTGGSSDTSTDNGGSSPNSNGSDSSANPPAAPSTPPTTGGNP